MTPPKSFEYDRGSVGGHKNGGLGPEPRCRHDDASSPDSQPRHQHSSFRAYRCARSKASLPGQLPQTGDLAGSAGALARSCFHRPRGSTRPASRREVLCQVPFIIGYHPGPNDYWRFTKEGMAQLFVDPAWQMLNLDTSVGHGTGAYRIAVECVAVTASLVSNALYIPAKGCSLPWLWLLLNSSILSRIVLCKNIEFLAGIFALYRSWRHDLRTARLQLASSAIRETRQRQMSRGTLSSILTLSAWLDCSCAVSYDGPLAQVVRAADS